MAYLRLFYLDQKLFSPQHSFKWFNEIKMRIYVLTNHAVPVQNEQCNTPLAITSHTHTHIHIKFHMFAFEWNWLISKSKISLWPTNQKSMWRVQMWGFKSFRLSLFSSIEKYPAVIWMDLIGQYNGTCHL